MFRLINLQTGMFLANERSNLSFEDGKRAARAAKIASASLKTKVQVRKVEPVNEDWRERERARFASGEYHPLCDDLKHWVNDVFPDHFAHVAKKRPGLIAYTKDELKGAEDKQSLMSIRAYVQMIHDECERRGWSRPDVNFVAGMQEVYASVLFKPFKLATTPEDIANVYTNYRRDASSVASSCMHYGLNHWPCVDGEPYHPASVYGAGDLAIAYIDDDDGKTVARALVWPDRKLYSRVYAEGDALHNALKAAGYAPSRYHGYGHPSIKGARLLRVENEDGNLVCPYLDEVGDVADDGEHLIIGGPIAAQRTDGCVRIDDSYGTCEHCGESIESEDDVYRVLVGRHTTEEWCSSCNEEHTFYCDGNNETYSDDVEQVEVDGSYYSCYYADDNAYRCERTGNLTFELHQVIVDEDGNTQEWCENARDDYAFEYEGDWYSDDIKHEDVIVQRYVPILQHRASRWDATFTHRLPSSFINAWYIDETVPVPTHKLADGIDGERIVTGPDGKRYLSGYTDNYPVARPRMDTELMETEYDIAA